MTREYQSRCSVGASTAQEDPICVVVKTAAEFEFWADTRTGKAGESSKRTLVNSIQVFRIEAPSTSPPSLFSGKYLYVPDLAYKILGRSRYTLIYHGGILGLTVYSLNLNITNTRKYIYIYWRIVITFDRCRRCVFAWIVIRVQRRRNRSLGHVIRLT